MEEEIKKLFKDPGKYAREEYDFYCIWYNDAIQDIIKIIKKHVDIKN
jgi:hypothetical protein